jgi:4-aminobutyrate aminotransferase
LAERHTAIADVRGLGLMIGVELRDTAKQPAAALMDDLLEALKDAGYLVGKTGPGRNVLTIMPPLIVEQEALDGLAECLDELLTRHDG